MAREQLSALLDMSGQLLGDNNYKVRRSLGWGRGALRALH
jgi:hypothetical protein